MNDLSILAPNLFQIQNFNKDNLDEDLKQFTYSGYILDSNVFK
jgi:hypothetical protein